MNTTVIVLGVIVVILLYILFQYYMTTRTVLSTALSLKNANPDISVSSYPMTYRYSYGVWIYVNSWDNTTVKPIFSRPISSTNSKSQIYVYLDKVTPSLRFNIENASGVATSEVIVTDNFPIQKWTYFTVSVDNQYVDLYLDGKLVKSYRISSPPMAPGDESAKIKIGGMATSSTGVITQGSDIFLASFVRWANPLSPQEVWNNYIAGNGGNIFKNLFSKYGVKVSITNQGVETTKFNII
jgi:hypothetical protein